MDHKTVKMSEIVQLISEMLGKPVKLNIRAKIMPNSRSYMLYDSIVVRITEYEEYIDLIHVDNRKPSKVCIELSE